MDFRYLELIQNVYPDLSIEEVAPNDIGQNNDVFIINHCYVFRFPKYKAGITGLKIETALLESIQHHATIPIPNPVYKSFEAMEVGKVFAGYKLIQGTPLWKEELVNIQDKNVLNGLATQLSAFLHALHSIPRKQIAHIFGHETREPGCEIKEWYAKIQNMLYPLMREDAREKVSRMFDAFLAKEKHLNIKQTLIHGDFGASNILWEADCCRISGIIDFGGSGLGDPAYDFAGILASYGEDFLSRCLHLYPDGLELLDRAIFYKKTFALQEALHGVEHNDREALENGIRDYR
ncbi:phosphotransferase family protein [Paenibacillus sp. J2TS4]|uniref:phosphotransferase family protein n=1 Tax=Paenibacillus sp. J2TS4 TaxID=2807194 RepID=UPI001AFCE4A4|nr:aminoglycoside phosphotransferase family protein [Paenibacillus sp. J2TS4]GIP31981.1 6'-aminoglycoside N-acetyltransferase [Paenibacillus sp. J2TS4]